MELEGVLVDLEGATVLDLAGVSLLDVDAGSITPVVDCLAVHTVHISTAKTKNDSWSRIALVLSILPCNFRSRVYSRDSHAIKEALIRSSTLHGHKRCCFSKLL